MSGSSFLNPTAVIRAAGIDEGMKVADFGASSGFFTRAAARAAGAGGAVWAVDNNPELLSRIKNVALAEHLRTVEVIRGECDHVGGTHLPQGHFDFVLVCNTLFAVECKGCLAEEAARVLKRGGKVVVVDWSDSHGGLGPQESHVVGKEAARELFVQAGFTYVEDIPAGAYHWGCILKKK